MKRKGGSGGKEGKFLNGEKCVEDGIVGMGWNLKEWMDNGVLK
jgi:hypothetical protein